MSILTKDIILEEIKKQNIKFDPNIEDSQISDVSVDLRLDNVFRKYIKQIKPIKIKEETNYLNLTEEITCNSIIIKPGETILGITKEKICLPSNLCGWLEGRSRFARLGLLIHISAGLVNPGCNNRQVLEITNLSPNELELVAGEKICQIIFERCVGNEVYQGKFANQ